MIKEIFNFKLGKKQCVVPTAKWWFISVYVIAWLVFILEMVD